MADFLLTSFGTRGDVQPVVALGLFLHARGHCVRIVASPDLAAWAKAHAPELEYVPAGCDVHALLEQQKHLLARSPLRVLRALRTIFAEEIRAQAEALLPRIAKDTIVVAAGVQFSAGHVAQARGSRYVYLAMQPQIFRSRAWPPPVVRSQSLPSSLNRLAWAGSDALWNGALARPIGKLRRSLGLAPARDAIAISLGEEPLLCCDPLLIPPRGRQDVGTVLGALYFEDTRPLSPALEAFLATGAPTIYVGFGSMVDDDPEATVRIVLSSAKEAGLRVVLSRGWAQYATSSDSSVHVIGDEPHLQLFPRVACVLHHGGSGTTHASLRSGVPQIVVPHTLDQYFWGARAHAVGVGPRPIDKARLSIDRLASAFATIGHYRAQARRQASLVRRDAFESLAHALEATPGGAR